MHLLLCNAEKISLHLPFNKICAKVRSHTKKKKFHYAVNEIPYFLCRLYFFLSFFEPRAQNSKVVGTVWWIRILRIQYILCICNYATRRHEGKAYRKHLYTCSSCLRRSTFKPTTRGHGASAGARTRHHLARSPSESPWPTSGGHIRIQRPMPQSCTYIKSGGRKAGHFNSLCRASTARTR